MKSLIPLGDKRGIRAELLDVFLNRVVESGDQRGDQHDHAHAQHHAEHRKRAAHLVRAQRVHRLLQIFAIGLRHMLLSVRSQRFDGIQLRRPHGRINPKKQSDRRWKATAK